MFEFGDNEVEEFGEAESNETEGDGEIDVCEISRTKEKQGWQKKPKSPLFPIPYPNYLKD